MNEMPFIMSRVNIKISKNKELMLKKRLGLAIANVPGKSEKVLMVGFKTIIHFI